MVELVNFEGGCHMLDDRHLHACLRGQLNEVKGDFGVNHSPYSSYRGSHWS